MNQHATKRTREAIRYGELLARLLHGPMDREEVAAWCREPDGGVALLDALWWGSVHRTDSGGVELPARRYHAAKTRFLREIYEIDKPGALNL